mmetsp:Transcript_9701/g.14700  ORF Transcript_9701/g.14700 Transcript_9701/m.14700 type:complete len:655 (-) Transcript_9701:1145-3109(-)
MEERAAASSKEDPPKMDPQLQISSVRPKNDKGRYLCKVIGCDKTSQNCQGFCAAHHAKLFAGSGECVEDDEDGSSDEAPISSVTFVSKSVAITNQPDEASRKRQRNNNGPITNLLSRQVLSLVPNIEIPEQPLSFMKKWKALVGRTDLRPLFGCSMCGPSVNEKIFDLSLLEGIDLCPFCILLQKEGWTQQLLTTNVKYIDPSGKFYYGVTSFLRATTSIIQQRIASTSAEDMNDKIWMVYPVEEYPPVVKEQKDDEPSSSLPTKKYAAKKKNSSTETKQSSPLTKTGADGDDFNGLSIMSLATSLSKDKELPQSDPFLVHQRQSGVSRRRLLYISHPDPRPIASCSWCGVDPDVEKLCPVCDALKEHGWSSYHTTDQMFRDHNKEKYRCVKNFLLASTDYVVKAMNVMSEEDRLRLIGKYENFNEHTDTPTTPQKRQRNNHTETNDSEIVIPKRPKEITIELPSISQLLTQDNGLEGVLKADLHSIYNLHFGTEANIAAKILTTLGKGDIPPDVENEVPLPRSSQTIQKCSDGSDTLPSRFVGVFRVFGDESSYAVAIPEFRVDCLTPPNEATVNNGQLCLLRVGMKEEKTAGQLFAYMYRALYGTKALSDVLKENQQDLTSQVTSGGLKVEEPITLEKPTTLEEPQSVKLDV